MLPIQGSWTSSGTSADMERMSWPSVPWACQTGLCPRVSQNHFGSLLRTVTKMQTYLLHVLIPCQHQTFRHFLLTASNLHADQPKPVEGLWVCWCHQFLTHSLLPLHPHAQPVFSHLERSPPKSLKTKDTHVLTDGFYCRTLGRSKVC